MPIALDKDGNYIGPPGCEWEPHVFDIIPIPFDKNHKPELGDKVMSLETSYTIFDGGVRRYSHMVYGDHPSNIFAGEVYVIENVLPYGDEYVTVALKGVWGTRKISKFAPYIDPKILRSLGFCNGSKRIMKRPKVPVRPIPDTSKVICYRTQACLSYNEAFERDEDQAVLDFLAAEHNWAFDLMFEAGFCYECEYCGRRMLGGARCPCDEHQKFDAWCKWCNVGWMDVELAEEDEHWNHTCLDCGKVSHASSYRGEG